MRRFSNPWRVLTASAAAGALVLCSLSGALSSAAQDAPPSGYPTWSDVQKAKGSQVAKAAEVTRINGLLDSLQNQSEALGTAAVTAAGEYATAKAALDAASAKSDVLDAQTQRAAAQATKYKKQAGAMVAQSYKTAGANLGIFMALDTLSSDGALQQLDLLRAVTGSTTSLYNRSTQAEGAAQALTSQQKAAEDERARLAENAASKLEAAQAAQQAMDDQLAQQKAQSQVLVAQLASLQNTTTAVEQKYRQGVQAQAAYEAAQEAKRQAAAAAAAQAAAAQQAAAAAAQQSQGNAAPAAPAASGPAEATGGYIPVNVLLPNIPGGAVNDPGGAQAYAGSRLAAHGWGSDQMGCLVQLWNRESSWLTNATNPTSGAYGIAQALPPGKYSTSGSDWLTNYRTQIDWGLGYIAGRYGSPCGAWAHEQSSNWY